MSAKCVGGLSSPALEEQTPESLGLQFVTSFPFPLSIPQETTRSPKGGYLTVGPMLIGASVAGLLR